MFMSSNVHSPIAMLAPFLSMPSINYENETSFSVTHIISLLYSYWFAIKMDIVFFISRLKLLYNIAVQ